MLADILPRVAESLHNNKRKPNAYNPSPSTMGPERCLRQYVYQALGVPRKPLPGRAIMVFDDSSWHEELTLDWLRQTTYKVHSEQLHVQLDCKLDFLPQRICPATWANCHNITIPQGYIAGHIDGIVSDPQTDYILEHKAINHFTFQQYWSGKLPSDYITQTSFYIASLQPYNVKRGILLIKNKNTSQFIEYLIEYDYTSDIALVLYRCHSNRDMVEMNLPIHNVLKMAINRVKLIHDHAEKRVLPLREYSYDDWQCEYCGWNRECYKNYIQECEQKDIDILLPKEAIEQAQKYVKYTKAQTILKKRIDSIQKDLRAIMQKKNCRLGIAEEFICEIKTSDKEVLDTSLLPQYLKDKIKQQKITDQFSVKKQKTIQPKTVNQDE